MNDGRRLLVEMVTKLNPELRSEDIIKYITSNQERLIRYFQRYVPKHTVSNNITIAKALLGVEGFTVTPNEKYERYGKDVAAFITYVMCAEGSVMEQFAYGANLNDVIWLRESKLYNLDSIEKKFKKGYPIRQVRDVYSVLTTKYGVQNKFPYITGNNICISSRAPILTYDKAGSLTMVFVDITTRSTATYEEIENNVDIAKGMANARISGVKSLRAVNKDGKLHYAQYAIGQGHIRISYDVDK